MLGGQRGKLRIPCDTVLKRFTSIITRLLSSFQHLVFDVPGRQSCYQSRSLQTSELQWEGWLPQPWDARPTVLGQPKFNDSSVTFPSARGMLYFLLPLRAAALLILSLLSHYDDWGDHHAYSTYKICVLPWSLQLHDQCPHAGLVDGSHANLVSLPSCASILSQWFHRGSNPLASRWCATTRLDWDVKDRFGTST